MKFISTADAPQALGHYSQAVLSEGLLFVSGQLGIEPKPSSFEEEVRQALANVLTIVRAAGGGSASVVKTTVFLTDIANFPVVNSVYEYLFGSHKPARAVVEVSSLPKGARIEVEAIARI
ncbi:hypothetical protein J7K18_08525 [bacterium]|nr:hypothetical protein [bacterium]